MRNENFYYFFWRCIMMSRRRNFLGCCVLCLMALSLAASASVTDPNIISAAVAVNGTAPEPLVVVKGGLWEGALPYVDRTYPFGDANDLGGLDYVQTAVDDKNDSDVEYHVTVDKAGTLFLIIDNRVGDEIDSDPPTLGSGVMDWVDPNGFAVTPYTVNISTPGTVYAKSVTPGTYVLGAQYDGTGRVMYVVAAAPDGWNFRPTITGVPVSTQVVPGNTLVVDSTVADDGIPGTGVSVQWTTLSTPDGATVGYSPDDTSEDVEISFSELGDYTLQITADDGEKVAAKTIQVAVQVPTFAVQASTWCTAGNDSDQPPTSYRHSSISYARNHSAPRRRIEYVQYDISGQKEAGEVYANSYLTINRDKGSLNEVLSVFAVREEYDNVDLTNSTTAVWESLPGVVNTPNPAYSEPITFATHIDQSDVSPLLMETVIDPLDVWVDTAKFAALDEFLNSDTDGIITLMFVTFSPEDADFEICSPSHSRSLTIDGVALKGIILRGNVTTPTWATNPVPAINTSQSTTLAQLSWTNPPAVGTLTCDVWIGTGDPNDPVGSGDGFTLIADDTTGNTASLSGYTLAVNTTYNWVVNVTDSGTGETTQGYVWSFNTNNAYPTVDVEEPFQYLWLNNDGDPASATAVINATASDDGFPNPTLGLLWEQIDGPATVAIDPNNVEDITLVLPATGTYTFQLSANDGDLVGTGATEIFVGDTPCDAAKAKPGYSQINADFDNNCYVDLNDFSEFALHWLECHSYMDASCAP